MVNEERKLLIMCMEAMCEQLQDNGDVAKLSTLKVLLSKYKQRNGSN